VIPSFDLLGRGYAPDAAGRNGLHVDELRDSAVGPVADVGRRISSLRIAPEFAIAAAVAALAVYRLWDALLQSPIVWSDSQSYEAVGSHSVTSTALWAGQRPPLVPIVWHVARTPTTFVVFQTVFSLLCWSLLAATVATTFRSPWRRVVAAFVVLGFATVSPVVLWDASVLSESISMSLLALLLATFIGFARSPVWSRAAAVVGSALAFALTRDAQVFTVALLGLATAVFFLVRHLRRRPVALPVGILALALLVGAVLSAWGSVASGRTEQNVGDALYVRVFPYPDRVAWFARHGMPQARAIDELARAQPQPAPGTVAVVGIDRNDPRFAAWESWLHRRGEPTYELWLLTHPGYVVLEPLRRPERAFNFAAGNLDAYAALDRVDSPLTGFLWPSWRWLVVLAAFGCTAPLVAQRIGRREVRVLALFAVVGLASMLLAWHGDGQETTRHTVEGLAEVHLTVLLTVVLLVLGEGPAFVARAMRARHGADETGADPGEEMEPRRAGSPV